MIQRRDLKNVDGGINFENEKFRYSSSREGLIAMGNYGTNTTLKNSSLLNGICEAFGWIFKGIHVIKEAEEVETYAQSKSKIDILIENYGEINIKEEHWCLFLFLLWGKKKIKNNIWKKYL